MPITTSPTLSTHEQARIYADDADRFSHALEGIYGEVVHWRPNIFKIPLGNSGKYFVHKSLESYTFASASSMESIARKSKVILLLASLK